MEERIDIPIESQNPAQPEPEYSALHKLIGVIVGLALIGEDTLREWLPSWEAEVARRLKEKQEQAGWDTQAPSDSGAPQTPWFPKEWEYRLVGLAFESPNYVRSGLSSFWRLNQRIWRLTAPLRLPFDILGITEISQEWLDGFLERIRKNTEHLEKVGESEAEYSRILGSVAIGNTVKYFSDIVVENDDIRDVITVQTSSITGDAVEEIREQTVGADLLVDTLVQRLLRRPARLPQKMPAPPTEDKNRNPEW